MSEPAMHSCESCPMDCAALAAGGMTSDCFRVQTEVNNLAEFLATASLDQRPDLPQRSLEAVRQARRDLREHAEWIEGPAGLFEYVAESVPMLTPQVQCLCRQHAELDRCLEELESCLADYRPAQPATLACVRACALRLGQLMQRHRHSAGELVADAQQVPTEFA